MQIILVQSEVEQAIRDYIANRLTITKGTEIIIDLKATRGEEGFKATIDLIDPSEKTNLVVAKEPVTKTELQGSTQNQRAAVQEAIKQDVSDQVSESDDTGVARTPEYDKDQPGQEEKAEVITPKKSLFANLGNPKSA